MTMARDPEAYMKSGLGVGNFTVVAGSADDNAWKAGEVVDRQTASGLYKGAILNATAQAVLAAAQTTTVEVGLEDSADGSTGWATYGSTATVTITDAVGNERGAVAKGFDLQAAKRYIRPRFKANPSAANTDTVNVGVGIVLVGPTRYPAV